MSRPEPHSQSSSAAPLATRRMVRIGSPPPPLPPPPAPLPLLPCPAASSADLASIAPRVHTSSTPLILFVIASGAVDSAGKQTLELGGEPVMTDGEFVY